MAATALVTEDNRVGTIVFDCIVREKHTLSAQATEHAVEGVGVRTDHVHQKPDVLVLEVVASNTPVHRPETQDNGTREVSEHVEIEYSVGLLPVATGPLNPLLRRSVTERVTTKAFSPAFDRRQDVWRELRRLKEQGELITVVTSLEEYTNMCIEEVDTECTVSNGRSLEAAITLKRIAITQSKIVDAPEIPKPPVAKGRQNTTPASADDSDRASALFKGAASIGALP